MTWHMGKAWVDRWLRRREAEKRAETPTLTVQQKSCHQVRKDLEADWCDSIPEHGAGWGKGSVYLTRIGYAALLFSAQANMVQSVLNAKEMKCLDPGATLIPTALKAEQGGHNGLASSLWSALARYKGCRQWRLQPAPGSWVRWEHRDISEPMYQSFPHGLLTGK